jgi:5-methylcytosine-specific restriction protein A
MALMHICAWPGCFAAVPISDRYCDRHETKGAARDAEQKARREQRRTERRGSSSARGYGYAWAKAAQAFLKRHPLCAECERTGLVTAASCVDHIVPHKGNKDLFWDRSNWQPLCHNCHSKKTAREDGGFGNPAQGDTRGGSLAR